MDQSWFSLNIAGEWVVLAVLGGAVLSFILYSKKSMPWSRNMDLVLGFLRLSTLMILLLLLLNPLLKRSVNSTEKPSVVLALDNSSSIPQRMPEDILNQINSWIRERTETTDDYTLNLITLSEGDSLLYNHPTTNLSKMLHEIENLYEGRNLGAVFLFSDGIYNQGQSPSFLHYPFPVYTIGLGDTLAPKDLSINSVRHNQVAYQNNKFPVLVDIEQNELGGSLVQVLIKEDGQVLARKNQPLASRLTPVNFELLAEKPGLRHLTIEVAYQGPESTKENNVKDIFVNVIEGKEKVLILAPAPHPDIKAINSVLTNAANYETYLYIPGIHTAPPSKDFDVIIEHNAFSGQSFGTFKTTGRWYILGDLSRIQLVNSQLPFIRITQRGNQTDRVTPVYNGSFTKFDLKEGSRDAIKKYPPVFVPFGQYELTGPTEVLLNQKIGNIETSKPLMVFYDDGSNKSSVTFGNGLWQWKLQEAASSKKPALFEDLILKTVQFLSLETNKNRVVVTPRQHFYTEDEQVIFDAQVYNEILERTYNNEITLVVTDENDRQQTFKMTDSPINSSINLGKLSKGIYHYLASVSLGGKVFTDRGQFAVRELKLEALNLTADHNLLRLVADRSGGKFYHYSDLSQLDKDFENLELKNLIRTRESYFPLINSLWILFLLMIFISVEWGLRKYLGAY